MAEINPLIERSVIGLRAMKAVALADGELERRERTLLALCARVAGHDLDLDALAPASPADVAAEIHDETDRRRLVHRLVITAMVDEEVGADELRCIRQFADGLEVREPLLCTLQAHVNGHRRLMAFDFMRKSFANNIAKRAREREGLSAVWDMARFVMKLSDTATAAEYQRFEALPEESLGHQLLRYYRTNELAIPGERGGAPAALLFHDIGHVLTGFGTDVSGELRMAAFEAGYMREEDAFSITVFALLLFHMGQDLGAQAEPQRGRFDVEDFYAAIEAGREMRTDLTEWDPSSHWEKSVEEVRVELGARQLEP